MHRVNSLFSTGMVFQGKFTKLIIIIIIIIIITEHVTTQEERDLLELPVRLGGLGLVNPARTASQEYEASVKITGPLVRQIVKQAHEPPDETEIKTLQASARREKDELLKMQCEQVRQT